MRSRRPLREDANDGAAEGMSSARWFAGVPEGIAPLAIGEQLDRSPHETPLPSYVEQAVSSNRTSA
jgi:hypothetical protein